MLGFAMAAPLVLWLTIGLIAVASVTEQKELAAEVLRQEVSAATKGGASWNSAAANWLQRATAAGWRPSPVKWRVDYIGEQTLLGASATVVLPSGQGDVTTTLQATSVLE